MIRCHRLFHGALACIFLLPCLASRLCTTAVDAITGSWQLSSNLEMPQPALCPSYAEHIHSSCASGFRSAKFTRAAGCSVLSFSSSLAALSGEILVVGDSLSFAIYQTLLCEAEDAKFPAVVNFVQDGQLRPECVPLLTPNWSVFSRTILGFAHLHSTPCHPSCPNASFRNADVFHTKFSCSGCNVTNSWAPKAYDPHDLQWIHRSRNAMAVIIGTGAWYSPYYLREDPVAVARQYTDTVTMAAKLLGKLSSKKPVIWMGLPPFVPPERDRRHGWSMFAQYDDVARSALQQHAPAVVFVNVSLYAASRKIADTNVSSDGLHWCTMSQTSVTRSLLHIVLHLLVVAFEQG